MRGKKERAREGRIPCGGFARLYGYDYIRVTQENGGRRVVNNNETKWVRQMFQWLVDDGLTTWAIAQKLNSLGVTSKLGNSWSRTTVWKILTNPAYTGKTTYASTIELPNATPQIIDETLYNAAQRQLDINAKKAKRNTKREYLLHGYVYCRQCGRRYWSHFNGQRRKYGHQGYRRYVCSGRITKASINRCDNKSWMAYKLEDMIWAELERFLSNRDLIVSELEKQRQGTHQQGVFEAELHQVERHLKAIDHEQHQLLQWALKGFPDDQIEVENRRLNKARATLKAQKAELETQLKASQEAIVSIPKLENFIQHIQGRISALDLDGKRQALDMLGIKVWINNHSVEVTGMIEEKECVTALPQS